MGGTNEKIPLLPDVLDLVQGKVSLLIEIKSRGKVGVLEPVLLDLLKSYSGQFAVQSFNPYVLQWFAKNAPEIPRGQLSGNFKSENLEWYKRFLLKNLLLNGVSKPHFVNLKQDCLNELPAKIWRLSKRPILTWTIRSNEELELAEPLSDNCVFEGFLPE